MPKDANLRKPERALANRILYAAVAVMFAAIFVVAVLLLNASIGDFESLSAERQAGLAASAVWEYLNLGDPRRAPGGDDHPMQAWGMPGFESGYAGPPVGSPAGGAADARQEMMMAALLDAVGDLVKKQSTQQTVDKDGDKDDQARQYLSRIDGLTLMGRDGQIVAQSGVTAFPYGSFADLLHASRQLPFGDRAYQIPGSDLLYLRNAGQRIRGPYGSGIPDRWLAVSYDTSDIRSESGLRHLLLLGLSLGGVLLLGAVVFFYRRSQQLSAQNAQQETLARLGLAARTLAHEIRNPLSVIVMQKSLLQKSLGEDYSTELKRIERESERISGLTRKVRDMLDKPEGQPQIISVPDTLKAMKEANLNWHGKVELQGGPVLSVRIDPEHFSTIIANLADNALRQHESKKTEKNIKVSWQNKAKFGEIHVADFGGGVPHRIGKRIFDAFFTTRTDGSGVGLSLSRSLARAAGGDIDFGNHGSGEDQGADFVLRLPRADGNTDLS